MDSERQRLSAAQFGARRGTSGLSYSRLQDATGIARSKLARFEAGRTVLTAAEEEALRRALDDPNPAPLPPFARAVARIVATARPTGRFFAAAFLESSTEEFKRELARLDELFRVVLAELEELASRAMKEQK